MFLLHDDHRWRTQNNDSESVRLWPKFAARKHTSKIAKYLQLLINIHYIMTYSWRTAFLLLSLFFSIRASAFDFSKNKFPAGDSLKFYDGQSFPIIGKSHKEKNYIRFAEKYNGVVRKPVWDLGHDAAGISIRFRSNATNIVIRWTLRGDANLPHMPATGVKGVDLYGYVSDHWQFVNTGIPDGKSSESTLLNRGDGVSREYLLNLPLYEGVDSVFIGVNANAEISSPKEKYLLEKKPVVYYGSSIAQGGVATRPGMAFTNILSRKLNRSFINLGFSGNGTFDSSVGQAMSEVDAALYVIDCNPNTPDSLVYGGALHLVQLLKSLRPEIPILLVEGFDYDTDAFRKEKNASVEKKRAGLKKAFEELQRLGVKQLYYRKGNDLIGSDHEGTVDGVHPNDIGMMRIADALMPVIRSIAQ